MNLHIRHLYFVSIKQQIMKKTTNIIYLIFGAVMPILIGCLHTWAHYNDLTTDEVKNLLSDTIIVTGQIQIVYNTWGLMSFLMGFSFIIIGLLHCTLIRHRGWNRYPSIAGCLLILLCLLGSVYVGSTFHAIPQYYGGIVGTLVMILCIILSIVGTKKEAL